jgi:hypothetical protein
MRILLWLILSIPSAFAEGKLNLAPQPSLPAQPSQNVNTHANPNGGGGAADLLNVTRFTDLEGKRSGNTVKFKMSCTDSTGKVLKPGDHDYSDCMAAAQNRNAPALGAKDGSQVMPTFNMGVQAE